jgi:alanine-glyoxylate transaminase/serine-glyoxylate transaminase/serine-pyruvate transaminase
MLMAALAGSEMAMLDCGVPIEAGSGVAAAAAYWRARPAPAGAHP